MVSTPRKRHASRSPEGDRYAKRQITSSPEEGEVDDTAPPVVNPTILPISLPQKPPPPTITKKVPFPFKKKADSSKNGAGGETAETQDVPLNVFDRFEEDAKKAREEPRRNRAPSRPMPKFGGADHWEPSFDRGGDSLLSRMEPREPYLGNSRYHYSSRDDRDDRDGGRRRSSLPRRSPRRSRSPSPGASYYRGGDKHRLPAPRSPPANFSPPSQINIDKLRERSRERGYERDRDRERDGYGRWDDDSRRYGRRNSPLDDSRYYRPSDSYRRGDDREWTRRDVPYLPDRRSSNRADDRAYDYDRRPDSSRWSRPPSRPSSPGPSVRSGPISPPPPPPPALPHPDIPRSPSPPPVPPPPALPNDTGPRPPSSTPPPAPPPDIRLMKDTQLPQIHAQVKITMKRPEAPRAPHSPLPLELAPVSTAKAMAHGPERRNEKPPNEANEATEQRRKEIEQAKIRMIRRKLPMRRSQKAETLAYGHSFTGCGLQSDYEATTKLGEGTFGEVHKAVHKSTGTIVALKRILMHNEKEGMPVTALREIKILKALKHPCIVDILDMFVVRSTDKDPLLVYMVFPYMDHDLAGLLENERVKLQPSHIKLYMKQLLEGTEYMHRNHILHRDMKAANLLISNNGSLRIADFGLARSFDTAVANGRSDGSSRSRDRKYTNCVVTRWYRPPELLLGARHYGGEVDIWGIGCVLGEMFTRKPILPGTSDLDQLEKIWFLCGSPNQHNWPYFDQLPGCEGIIRFTSQPRRLKPTYESVGPETVDLLDKLLVINPKERLTAAQALEHDYFWTDPLPADPKSMPSYEASHEYDKRGHRNHPPMPIIPPIPHQHGNQPRHPQPPGNPQQFNRGGPKNGPPPHAYGSDVHKRGGGGPQPPYHLTQGGPPPHTLTNGPPPYPNAFRNGPPPPPGAFNSGYGGPPGPPGQYPPSFPRQPYGAPRGQPSGPRADRRDMPRNNNPTGPSMRLPLNPNLPARPIAPLGSGPRDSDRHRGGYNDRRSEHSGPPDAPPSDGPPGGVLNYG